MIGEEPSNHLPLDGRSATIVDMLFDILDVDMLIRRRGVLLVAFALVRLGVFGQVVGAHEPFAALGAREALLAGVRPQVALQFVGARERLAAEEPLAAERALAGVPP